MFLTLFSHFLIGLILFGFVFTVLSRNPIIAIVSLISVFLNSAVLFVALGLEFIGIIFLFIYVGAIAILFLFVIFMLNIRISILTDNILRYLPVGFIFLGVFFYEIVTLTEFHTISYSYIDYATVLNAHSTLDAFAEALYSVFLDSVILSSLILLLALISVIVLTARLEKRNVK